MLSAALSTAVRAAPSVRAQRKQQAPRRAGRVAPARASAENGTDGAPPAGEPATYFFAGQSFTESEVRGFGRWQAH